MSVLRQPGCLTAAGESGAFGWTARKYAAMIALLRSLNAASYLILELAAGVTTGVLGRVTVASHPAASRASPTSRTQRISNRV